jgi:hypothetical protein
MQFCDRGHVDGLRREWIKMSESDSDLLDALIKRMQEGTADRLDRQRQEAGGLKTQEEMDSERRLEEMWMREYERQRVITDAQMEQRRQEQLLVRYVLIGAAVIILILIILTVALSLSGGASTPESLLPLYKYV